MQDIFGCFLENLRNERGVKSAECKLSACDLLFE